MASKFICLEDNNFFDRLRKETPRAMELFSMELEKFRVTVEWDSMFVPTGLDDKQEFIARKFTDLPYVFQKGFIYSFFVGNNIMVYVNPSPDPKKKGYTWLVVDTITDIYAKSFLSDDHVDITVFKTHMQGEIDSFNAAFNVLEERFNDQTKDLLDGQSAN